MVGDMLDIIFEIFIIGWFIPLIMSLLFLLMTDYIEDGRYISIAFTPLANIVLSGVALVTVAVSSVRGTYKVIRYDLWDLLGAILKGKTQEDKEIQNERVKYTGVDGTTKVIERPMNTNKGTGQMKIYLDDERETPEGWTRCYWPDEVIELLKGDIPVSEVSLDHDLGDDERGTGYDVLTWIEEQVVTNNYVPPKLKVHSANVSARIKMALAIQSIEGNVRGK